MSEVKIATRESYGNALVELGGEHENLVVLDADLAAATKTGMFKKAFPDRHIDCGIAEGSSPTPGAMSAESTARAAISSSSRAVWIMMP